MTEIWKPVKGFEKYYLVSNTGKILSLRTGALRKLQANVRTGYYMLFLCEDNGKEQK